MAQTVGRSLPSLSKVVVTKQRTEILPLIAAAIAAHPGTCCCWGAGTVRITDSSVPAEVIACARVFSSNVWPWMWFRITVPETRLALIHLLLTVVPKPTDEERGAIVLVWLSLSSGVGSLM